MRQCFIHSQKIESIFQLLGEKENDITYSLGWVLSQSDALFNGFLKSVLKSQPIGTQADIHLQKYGEEGNGFTDVEIMNNECHIIIEAKIGWSLPSAEQLMKYQRRLGNCSNEAMLITLSECSNEYFKNYFHASALKYKVIHISWKDLHGIVEKAKTVENHAGKRLLDQFATYLERIMTIQNKESNLVYVVSIASGSPKGCEISRRDIVERKHKYYHPISGGGWPNTPPNYIAFRYDGKLQSIHHVDNYVVTKYVHDEIEEIPKEKWEPHFVYSLGPAIKPQNEVRTGNIFRNGRVWCMLDTLLTSKTISDARDISKKRLGKSRGTTPGK